MPKNRFAVAEASKTKGLYNSTKYLCESASKPETKNKMVQKMETNKCEHLNTLEECLDLGDSRTVCLDCGALRWVLDFGSEVSEWEEPIESSEALRFALLQKVSCAMEAPLMLDAWINAGHAESLQIRFNISKNEKVKLQNPNKKATRTWLKSLLPSRIGNESKTKTKR